MIQLHRLTSTDAPDIRVYFSREPLTNLQEQGERGDGENHSGIVEAALELPGVVVAAVKPYSLMLMRAPCFEWNEIESGVKQLLTAFNAGEGVLEGLQEPPALLGR